MHYELLYYSCELMLKAGKIKVLCIVGQVVKLYKTGKLIVKIKVIQLFFTLRRNKF